MAKKRIATFLGPSEGLVILGDHCVAYSGSFAASTTPATRLLFTTGKYYIVGEIRLCGMIDETTAANGRICTMTVKMNGSKVLFAKTAAAEEDMPSADVVPIIIPANTQVEVIQDANDDEAAIVGSISVTGKIYTA